NKRNSLVRRAKRAAAAFTGQDQSQYTSSTVEADSTGGDEQAAGSVGSVPEHEIPVPSPVLMGETVNVYHDPYETTQELKITDEKLMNLLRRKIKLNAPYAGVFLRKSSTEQPDVVHSLDDLHRIGTFVQIPEWDDLGSKMRILVIGHRNKRNSLVRRAKRAAAAFTGQDQSQYTSSTVEADSTGGDEQAAGSVGSVPEHEIPVPSPVLMGETVNVYHDPYETTQELKLAFVP
ncbi:hypothetical protein AHF37_07481, partial [Paragonimus kellicotti]